MSKTGNALFTSLPWHRPCPACGKDNAKPLYLNRMAPIAGIDMSYQVGRCLDCGFSFATDLPTPATYSDYYTLLSKYDQANSVHDIPQHDRIRIRTAVELCQPHIAANALIVDIGCGVGALLEGFRQVGYSKLHGIDPAPDAGVLAERIFGLSTVRTGDLEHAEEYLPLADAGLICFTGVFEHLPQLYENTECILRQLPATAKVLIEVPALERFSQAEMEPFGEFSLEHVQYFSLNAMNRFMSRFGFSPVAQSMAQIPGLASDSLFSLYARSASPLSPTSNDESWLSDYIHKSGEILDSALRKIAPVLPSRFLVYGAGSHTARLLPKLNALNLEDRIVGVIDNNRNLHGKTIGKHTIYPPQFLDQQRGQTVLISTYRAQQAIAQSLRKHHPLVLMYP